MHMVCLDLEGVLVPEIWIEVSRRTGIEALKRTTRDEPDYDKLMRGRLAILAEHGLKLADIQSSISETKQPYYFGSGRFYLVGYEGQADGGVDYAANGVAAQGIMPLYQRCVHLGCRVPYCASSGWFECPCHGSQYNRVGEKKAGPAPRGMDHFAVTVSPSGDVVVDTSIVVPGVPIGTNTTGQEAEGPHCITGGGHH